MAAKKKVLKRERKKPISPGLLVSGRVQIRDVRLINCKCDQKPVATAGKKSYNIATSTDVQLDKDHGFIVVIAKFHFEAIVEKKSREPAMTIDASFVLTYRIESFEGLTREGFKQLANLNGIYNAWPYWREFVQNMIGRMGLPPLTMPVFRIVQTPPKAKPAGKPIKGKQKKSTKRILRDAAD